MQKFTRTLLASSLAVLVSSPAWAAEVPAGVMLADTQTITRGNGDEVPTLDPSMSSDTSSSRVISDMFEGLVSEDLDGNIIPALATRSEEHTSELQSRFGISYAVFCLKKKK